jgi:Type II secretion system (T2SS), protein G
MATMNRDSSKAKELYPLGLVCLIPGFGTIFGIIFSFFAILKYKSWRLYLFILLGTVGSLIIFVIADRQLIFEMKYGKSAADLASKLVVQELNTIVEKLDLYQRKYQQYPDSLEQLAKEYHGLVIKDPLLMRNPEAHTFLKYYYKRNGSKFELFSSGIDGIPHNQDDIYPHEVFKQPVDYFR